MKFEVADKVPLIASAATVFDEPPENPEPVGEDQVYCVPSGILFPPTLSIGVYANGIPLQTVCE
jgi:hypothetical protein